MSEHVRILGSQDVPADYSLDTIFEIEELLEYIAIQQHKVEHWEQLKKHRKEVIDEKIEGAKLQMDRLRKIILTTMTTKSPDDKTLDFSPIGKVTRKKASKKWEVQDEIVLLKFLTEKKMKKGVVETKEKIIKKALDDLLDSLSKKQKTIPGVLCQEIDESVSIKYDKVFKPVSFPKKEKEKIEDLDTSQLEI